MDVRIDNLSKSYGNQKAVDSISFDIKSGEIVGFLGPNGAGKTTTMKMLTQYMQPDSGTIWYDNSSSYDVDIRREIGYLPEHNPLYEDMPVMDYLAFSAALQSVPQSEIPSRVIEMVRICGLDIEKHKKIGELSKGYRQRVGLAQAIIHNPKVLILDEPTTGLDPNQIVEIRELIRKLGREKTVILSTHILPEVEATCDRILIINKGKIAADGTVQQLRKQSEGKSLLQVRIDGAPAERIAEGLRLIEGLQKVMLVDTLNKRFEIESNSGEEVNRLVYRTCVQNHWDLLEMIPFETKLEDIFRDLTIN
ncbi:MAG: ATP-binding cassette domain-containing protein [Saprospiraceae bacterium]|nr:ATP-binding cassette domain-containing protein [Saprospiraceae bacterium]MBK7737484.1 ATP-binding cassette domain-containing protein [Saprospiraceae bacterium]MBK7913936.1 ATP-binding cassette domain-containing protein [Saprospiraceae bacterium]